MNQPPSRAFPLALAGPGGRFRIHSHRPGKGIEKRLTGLGLHPGSVVEVVQQQGGGGMVLAREGGRIALGLGIAHKIMVTPA